MVYNWVDGKYSRDRINTSALFNGEEESTREEIVLIWWSVKEVLCG